MPVDSGMIFFLLPGQYPSLQARSRAEQLIFAASCLSVGTAVLCISATPSWLFLPRGCQERQYQLSAPCSTGADTAGMSNALCFCRDLPGSGSALVSQRRRLNPFEFSLSLLAAIFKKSCSQRHACGSPECLLCWYFSARLLLATS